MAAVRRRGTQCAHAQGAQGGREAARGTAGAPSGGRAAGQARASAAARMSAHARTAPAWRPIRRAAGRRHPRRGTAPGRDLRGVWHCGRGVARGPRSKVQARTVARRYRRRPRPQLPKVLGCAPSRSGRLGPSAALPGKTLAASAPAKHGVRSSGPVPATEPSTNSKSSKVAKCEYVRAAPRTSGVKK